MAYAGATPDIGGKPVVGEGGEMWMEFVVDEMEFCVAGQTWDDFGSLLHSSNLRADCWQAGIGIHTGWISAHNKAPVV